MTFMAFPGLDDVSRVAGFIAILCSAASMTSSVVSLFRFKVDMERALWHYDMATSGMTLLTVCRSLFAAYFKGALITELPGSFSETKRVDVASARVPRLCDRGVRDGDRDLLVPQCGY